MITSNSILNSEYYESSLVTCAEIGRTLNGANDPNFKRIHHYNHHIALAIKEIMGDKCKVYCEIGTHFGHSLCTVLQSNYPSKYISIDLFQVNRTIASDCQIKDVFKLAKSNVNKFNTHNNDCTIIKGNSQDKNTIKRVKELAPEGIDLLFIDGDHSKNGVIKDFELYLPLVNSGGIIIFDDYLPLKSNGRKRGCPEGINEIISKYKSKLNIIGLIEDKAGANNIRNKECDLNIDFIVQLK